jgi:hypothetical protein
VRIAHIDVPSLLNAEQLESLRFRLLKPSLGTLIEENMLVTCDGKFKALLLREVLRDDFYRYALRALRLMKFKPAKDSDRKSIMQDLVGSDLLLGWLRPRSNREDWLRKGDRDQLFFAMRLVPLLRNFESLMAHYIPDYWEFHLAQAMRLVRPADQRFKTLGKVQNAFQRMMLERWDATRYYHFLGTQAFSTVTLNNNIMFGAHDDGRNVPGTLSCLTALGDYSGGTLCFPRLGVSFKLRPRDFLIADTNTEYHGNVGHISGERYSVVAYLHGGLLRKERSEPQLSSIVLRR